MFKVNENYLKLPGSYLFSTIGKKVAAFSEANPDKSIIRLGIGDVTQPLAPAIIDSLHKAVDEKMIIRLADAISQLMKCLFLTEQNVIPETFRKSSASIIKLQCATRYTRYMWIQM